MSRVAAPCTRGLTGQEVGLASGHTDRPFLELLNQRRSPLCQHFGSLMLCELRMSRTGLT